MNKEELVKALEVKHCEHKTSQASTAFGEALSLARQLDEPATNTSATHLSEQLKTVQEALEFYGKAENHESRIISAGCTCCSDLLPSLVDDDEGSNAREALSLLPVIVEGVAGMEAAESQPCLDCGAIFDVTSDTGFLCSPCVRGLEPALLPSAVAIERIAKALQPYVERDWRTRAAEVALAAIQHSEGEK